MNTKIDTEALALRQAHSAALDFLAGGGEMGALMRAHDWSSSALGPPESWPQSLRTAVRLLLNTGHPMYIWWGESGSCLYNDAYRLSIGPERHPGSLGRPAREVWDEIWDIIGPQIGQVMAGKGATWHEDHLVPITRHGRREEVYWTYSFSPIDDETAPTGVGGVLVVCTETTQKVLTKQRLASEIERQRRLFQCAPGFIAVLRGPDHIFEFANDAYVHLAGKRDFIGKTVREVFPELAGAGFFETLDNVFRTGERFLAKESAIRLQRAAHAPIEERFLDFIYEPVIDVSGEVTGIFVQGFDVTERKAAEIALKELNATLEARVEQRTRERDRVWVHARDLAVVVDHDGVFRAVNPAWTRILGHATDEVVGHSFLDFIHPADAEATRAGVATAAGGTNLTNFTNRYIHKNGDTRWISWHTAVEGDLVFAYGRDITAEKLATEALELSEARLRTIFETSYLFQGLLTPEGIVLDANATSLGAIEAQAADVIGKPFCDTAWFSGTPGMRDIVRQGITIAASGQLVRNEILVQLPVGGWRWFDFMLRPVRDNQGAVVAIVPEATEITERKQAEEALRQSQKLEAMGQLTGGVAHDFNNLLTPIIGSLDMLQRRTHRGEREQRLIEGALQSAERAKTLVQRLLAFARRQPLQPIPVDVAALVTGIADLIASTTGPQIKVVVEAEDGMPAANADPNQLEMAVLNLSVNARDAMPHGGTLRISATRALIDARHRSRLEPGCYVRLSVADTGVGMDEKTLRRAVEPFFSTKGIGKGTGLGLSMVHGLASQLGGALTISSKFGVGTNVDLWLPVSEEPAVASPAAPNDAAPTTLGTALLVDDEDLVRMSTADMLNELGFEVLEARSAEEALGIFERRPQIDLLVTDQLMPGMNGVELAHAIRERRPHVQVLVVSGFADTEAMDPNLSRLTKPFRLSDLATSLATLGGVDG